MEEKKLNNWAEFERELEKLESQRNALRVTDNTYVSPLLFRGQADASWRLLTTLERYYNKEEIKALDYFYWADQIRPQIETYTGKSWDIEIKKVKEWIKDVDLIFLSKPPSIEYLIYLTFLVSIWCLSDYWTEWKKKVNLKDIMR